MQGHTNSHMREEGNSHMQEEGGSQGRTLVLPMRTRVTYHSRNSHMQEELVDHLDQISSLSIQKIYNLTIIV